MLNENLRRGLSLVLALVMVFSMMPVGVMATENPESTEEIPSTELITEAPEESTEAMLNTQDSEKATEEPTEATETPTEATETPTEATEVATEATEESTEATEESTETAEEPVISDDVLWVVEKAGCLLRSYLGGTVFSEEELRAVVSEMDWGDYQTARWEIMELNDSLLERLDEDCLTDAEMALLKTVLPTYQLFSDILDERNAQEPPISLFASNDVQGFGFSNSGDGSVSTDPSTGTATISVKASGFLSTSTKSTTATITNNTGNTAQLVFNYTFSGTSSSFSDLPAGATASDGKFSATLAAGASFKISISATAGKFSSQTSTFSITGIEVTTIINSARLTVQYNSTDGTVKANGTVVVAGEAVTTTLESPVTLVAVPASDAQFLAWVDPENGDRVVSTETTYTVSPTAENMTVKAAFGGNSPWFFVNGGKNLVEGWDNAVNNYSGEIILANDATLTAGNYEVPSGDTLIIPFSGAGTSYVSKPMAVYVAKPATPKAFRTLTMESGAHITVNGTMTVPATVVAGNSGNSATMPKDTYGHVSMKSESSITVNSGATLSAFGYITGTGSVIIKSGATAYEAFQVRDFRGGSATYEMNGGIGQGGNEGDVLPFSQYYIQNIEAPMTVYSGANVMAYVALYMSDTVIESTLKYIGASGSMFNLTSGYLIKRYDSENDRLIVDIYGNLSVESFTIEIKVGLTAKVNSSKYILPITSSMTVNVHTGTVGINADMAMIPGSEINIGPSAAATVASGKRFFIYDLDDWKGKGFVYPNTDLRALTYSPTRVAARTVDDLKDALITVAGTLDASAGVMYTTQGGGAIVGVDGGKVILKKGTETVTHQYNQTNEVYVEIPVTNAKLKNENVGETESYTETADITTATTYTYLHGRWATSHATDETKTTNSATCTSGGEKTTVCTCGYTTTEAVGPLGHTPAAAVEENRVGSTCTVPGSYESVVYCSACGEELSRDTVALELAEHTAGEAVEESRVDSTCTVPGSYESVVYCSACGKELSRETVVLELADHTPAAAVEESRVDSTCTVPGSYESVVYCSVCGKELSRETVALELAEHTAGEAVEENRVDSTCETPGSYESVVYCSVCNAELSRETVALALVEHTAGEAVEENRVDSTCETPGSYESVVYCSVCNDELSRDTVALELAEHTAGEAVEENRVDSTCTVPGSYESVVYCSVCNAELSRETVALDLAEHTEGEAVEENRVDSTCETPGSYESVVYCSACGEELSRDTVALKLADHTPAAAVEENRVDSTCTVPGSYESVVYCSDCNTELSRETIVVDALNHSNVTEETEWQNNDTHHWQICPDCGEKVNEGEHNYVDGKCDVCRKNEATLSTIMQIKSAALMFKDDIQIKFYFTVEGATDDELTNAGIEIWSEEDYDADNLGTPTQVISGLERNGSRYQIITDGIAAKNMGDLLHVRGYIEVNGVKEYTKFVEYSPAVYCKNKINAAAKNPDDVEAQDMAKLCISLMNYGAEAQKYFAQTTDYTYTSLMNEFLTNEQKAWTYDDSMVVPLADMPQYSWSVADTSVVKLNSASVLMTGALQVKLYATISEGTINMFYWTEKTAGNELLFENAIELADIGPNGSRYQGYVKGIAAKDMGKTIYLCASVTVDGTTYYTKPVAYSIHQYAANQISKADPIAELAKTLVIYSNTAKHYLNTYNTQ